MTTRINNTRQSNENMEGQPHLKQSEREIQKQGQLRTLPLGMSQEDIKKSITMLNQLLADTVTLYHLYKKHHWQVSGPTFYQLHLLLDKHAEELDATIDTIAERIQTLGGIAVAMPFDVAENTKIARPPVDVEGIPALLARTIDGHATVIADIREGIELTEKNQDYGTNDLLMSDLLRMHELQVWFVSQHLIDTPLAD